MDHSQNMDACIRDWSSLPELAVFDIAARLHPIQSLAFRSVCKSWRSVCIKHKAAINANKPPLLLRLDRSESPACHLCSFPDSSIYASHPLPPQFSRSLCDYQGFSHGYITAVLKNDSSALHCYSPFAGDQFTVPFPVDFMIEKVNCVVFTGPPRSGRCIVVVFTLSHILYCHFRNGDHSPGWSIGSLSELFNAGRERVLQAVMFKGLLYCLAGGKVYAIELQSTPRKIEFNPEIFVYNSRSSTTATCMLANSDELLVVRLTCMPLGIGIDNVNRVYRLRDPELGNWELVEDVGGRTLFATRCKGFLPCETRLLGFEQDWGDRILFADPFCNLPINSAAGGIWYSVDGCLFDFDDFSTKGLFSHAWIPPSLI